MKYLDGRRCGWDTETTAKNPTEARIVTAAIVGRGGVSPEHSQEWLINPGVPIPPETTAIHGIDDAKAQAEGQDPKAALEEIAETLARILRYGMPLVAFNTAYDWSVLHYELERHGLLTMAERLDGPPYSLLDALVLDKQADRYRKGSRKLQAVAAHYGVHLENWHEAKADAIAALGITDALYERNPRLDGYDQRRLYLAQQAWREEQQAGLQAHLRKTDPVAYCASEWPLVPAQHEGGAA
ncbi:exonuclease domain-containing protein [Streptomyces europaeiscabiei]|uniref:Exonuclease domain-containing protein n=1 Tax=Streptomyces europaeiscabiei TaxID=146819 RepID=A0ABU4NX46_9ACTN|nr:exonuclease domain-containing protein [Streptomyces europaeiscabiei]MDX2763365.1 exonuclease domain-containing protein [Streptomyces europaeiscabiei]MDX3544364.1 exonuclease domain-containing protein [Streptomyces europaeiscabiei]MDX3558837.1 exonuclease domain-containing protein [Streptomyces europaeiscabiei]MDX3707227.1 exonuclease domain-containing protein [Streptomyces europaeiscabiei]